MARKAGISLRTIAEATGVSVVTVSRALNRDFLVDPKTAARIQKAADKLGYKLPSQERRSVRIARGNTNDKELRIRRFGFIIPDFIPDAFKTPLSRGLQKGIADYLFEKKIELVHTHLDRNKNLPTILAKKEVDGYILKGVFSTIPLTKPQLAQMGRFPHVSIFGQPPLTLSKSPKIIEDYILPDDQLIGRIGLDRLVRAGVKKPLLISNRVGNVPLQEMPTFSRCSGFKYEADFQGIQYDSLEILTWDPTEIVSILERYMKKSGKPKGIFMTRPFPHMIEALDRLKLTPEQGIHLYGPISGLEDECAKLDMQGINLRPEALGRAAAELLIWRINHPEMESKTILIPPELVHCKK
ncbi:LacI family DNA-binding transcriptional regulator [Rubellicoccus peritrichatus]|uniref:LacI family DNA-binding transcriptional regulator n=1 Tax=Rubellicoccus peritrichatus TaxID=3080537 RepID=A0AAQ3L9Q2_9BACT|nr:LacI family DNA-binding transcriptional regulator [Puniceicoccus sp. CR14]WOO39925.1 LacI family DNA-binding transcriptional regulator [Puniceicoccus sp. CR14]